MRKASTTAVFSSDIQTIWDTITDVSDYAWRSDWRKVMGSENPNQFTVYSKDGGSSIFTITKKVHCEHYEFHMENNFLKGRWRGQLEKTEDGKTKLDILEELEIQNFFMGILSYLFLNLKKTQKIYIDDLKRRLGEYSFETDFEMDLKRKVLDK